MKHIQASGNLFGEWKTLKQINKTEAKKLFEQGTQIYLQASNMHPFGVWQSVCPVRQKQLMSDEINTFDDLTNSYKWYNCDNERGRYVHYYKSI